MKISETTSFPHPVLAPWSQDISAASIAVDLTLREDPGQQQVSIHCSVSLVQDDLIRLIDEGSAAFGCFITCRDTGFRRLQRFGFPSGSHHFAPGVLLGRVQLRPMIWATRPVPGYAPDGVHEEFSHPVDIEPGQILALDEEQRFDVLRPPLPSIESIFEIHASDELGEGEFEVDTEGDRVRVWMHEKSYALVQGLREGDDATSAVVMNALYVPMVMEVLAHLSRGAAQFDQYRWYEPFRARCEQLQVEITNPALLSDAQKLLGRPFDTLRLLMDSDEEEEPND